MITEHERQDTGGDPATGEGSAGVVPQPGEELGRGRSGVVLVDRDGEGGAIVRKVFGSSGLTKIVQYVFLGAPNPYMWCEAAVESAMLRRRILADLVRPAFGSSLRVSRGLDFAWDADRRAFALRCEFSPGQPVRLRHCFSSSADDQLQDLTQRVMRPLQGMLEEAGFDGLVWQAGRGNPVALNNFLCEGAEARGGYRWCWIDLESGVPALFPLNPVALAAFYLPRSIRHRRALFDDVDVMRLRGYVEARRAALLDQIGLQALDRLESDVDALEVAQRKWRSLPRYVASITCMHLRGSISDAEAEWWGRHPFRWHAREFWRGCRALTDVAARGLIQFAAMVARIPLRRALRSFWLGVTSQTYRRQLARDYVSRRVASWQDRGQLDAKGASTLHAVIGEEESGPYLADFGVHLAMKPVVKILQYWVVPALWVAGVLPPLVAAGLLVASGPVSRTLYTLVRIVENTRAGRERPWVALGVGLVPMLGNLAFPVQLLSSGAVHRRCVARFLIHDFGSQLGQWVPIWGGLDTYTEHFCNRVVGRMGRSGIEGAGVGA